MFGSLNAPMKLNSRVIAAWSQILLAVAGSEITLRCTAAKNPPAALINQFVQHGIEARRIHFVGRQPLADYLDLLGRIDIALDPFPYNGHTTSCDTLWTGVPLVVLRGDLPVSRVGASIMANVGLPRLIASSVDEYVRTAVELSQDIPLLKALRSELRRKLQSSPIMDYRSLMVRLERALCSLWADWCIR
jgi:predicted O-linked N-acetylglucosamine transferase (SPINDLY family)